MRRGLVAAKTRPASTFGSRTQVTAHTSQDRLVGVIESQHAVSAVRPLVLYSAATVERRVETSSQLCTYSYITSRTNASRDVRHVRSLYTDENRAHCHRATSPRHLAGAGLFSCAPPHHHHDRHHQTAPHCHPLACTTMIVRYASAPSAIQTRL